MKNKNYLWLPIFTIALCTISACDNDKKEIEAATVIRPVKTLRVESQNALSRREFTGLIDAERKVELAFRVSGTLQALSVLEGDEVKREQVLAQLDPREFEIRLQSRQADYQKAQADFQRAQKLVVSGVVTQSEFEQLEYKLTLAKAELERAELDLQYTQLTAPFAGIIAKRYVENSTEVAARSPVLTLMDLNSLVVNINVPESVMIHAQREGIRPDMYAVFAGHEEQQYPLSIREIATQADTNTQTFPVTLSLPPIDDLNVLPGMSVMVGVRGNQTTGDVVYVPAHTVLEDSEGRFVFVAKSENGDLAIIERRQVEVGDISAYGIQITKGLSDGEYLVTAGVSQLVGGQHVRLDTNNF